MSPRVVVYRTVADVEIMLVSAHSPIEGSEEHGGFWSQLERVLMSFHDPSLMRVTMVGIDSNGEAGSSAGGSVGPEEPDDYV